MNLDQAFDLVVGTEGGYSNRSPQDDPGGETMWGVTARMARAHGYAGEMRDLPKDAAKAIYAESYWSTAGIDSLPDAIRFDVFDAAVNSGPSQAIKWLQHVVGTDEDGVVGPHTLMCLSAVPTAEVRRRYTGARLHFMTSCSNWQSNSRGWAIRIADLLIEP